MTPIYLATWLLLGRYTAAAPGATEFLGDALAALDDRGKAATREPSGLALFFGVLWKLALVVLLIWITIWLLRRFLGTGPAAPASGGPIRVLASRHLDARHAVWILEVGERMLVVGGGGGSVSLLAEITSPVERAAVRETLRDSGSRFTSYLSTWAARVSGGETQGQLKAGKDFLSERLERMKKQREHPPEGPSEDGGA
ncbi:MAG: flagellar biosynthetic protein FliO [Candidatus Coatesbacteria bacterium]